MNDVLTLQSTTRVALAAYLHDLGKFAERARIGAADDKNADGNTRRDTNVQLYCPRNAQGRPTHIHAAYTAIAFDLIEKHLPEIVGDEMHPFAPWRERGADDSMINAAARHHRPDTALQWIVATADRLASGFERETFDAYNSTADDESQPLNHYTTRLWPLLEEIRLDRGSATPVQRYPLLPLSGRAIFPKPKAEAEHPDRAAAQREYAALWQSFVDGLELIPASHRRDLPLWLDHFDSLWLAHTHAIPAATANPRGAPIKPNVSLYDHSRTTAALAAALWRWHAAQGHASEHVRDELAAQWDREREAQPLAQAARTQPKWLLVQGDFFGIQDFIFTSGSSTQRHAARLLRGRSFYVSLLSELAALRVLEALALPPTSQVTNAAGKFLIVAPSTPAVVEALRAVQREFDTWFLAQTCGIASIGLAWTPACAEDFMPASGNRAAFRKLIDELFAALERAKQRRFGLCGADAPAPVFEGFLDRFESGECAVDERFPARSGNGEERLGALAADQIRIGAALTRRSRLLVTRRALDTTDALGVPIFGYHVALVGDEEQSGRFGALVRDGEMRRAFDFSLPERPGQVLWNGYARRALNAYVPRAGDDPTADERYALLGDDAALEQGEAKTLNHLALDDRRLVKDDDGKQRWLGVEALTTLKGDIDNLGLVFRKGLEQPTFARMAALSRQVNAFFAVHLPLLCRASFPNTYTVFAGGDDFFLIGPWHATMRLAQQARKDFAAYVGGNPQLHFSVGLSMTKPGMPVRQLAARAEDALERAKKHGPPGGPPVKNAVCVWGEVLDWDEFDALLASATQLDDLAQRWGLSTGYLYQLLGLAEMAGRARDGDARASLWASKFAYATRRLAERSLRGGAEAEDKRRQMQQQLGVQIADAGLRRFDRRYRVALHTHLYLQRD